MADIFDNKILCGKCSLKMTPQIISKDGINLRAVYCQKCNIKIIHPKDEQEYNNFMNLKKKQYHVKMRFVGNSYAVSIPKEIVNFIKDHERIMDNMVKLAFEDFGKISLDFGCQEKDYSDTKTSSVPGNKINRIKRFH
ncbi:hypothetical protein CMI38_06650 [Candidatus Pacearchaeota archaeon]|jgi:hypothetical protein|nr:hypothetical protein [Candidatus Pacearchaeota archaeon]|tara:strand:- start:193 stop:606 length:414 start_codon:yes stop_codon:yes gene_type:complete